MNYKYTTKRAVSSIIRWYRDILKIGKFYFKEKVNLYSRVEIFSGTYIVILLIVTPYYQNVYVGLKKVVVNNPKLVC